MDGPFDIEAYWAWAALGLTLFWAGLLAIILPAAEALRRRRWFRLLPFVAMLPFYYALITYAAWRALIELLRDPFGWHKTEHGLARTSRSGLLTGAGAAPDRTRPGGGSG